MKKILLSAILSILVATSLFSQWSVDSLINVCANDAVSNFKAKTMFVNFGSWELYDITTQNSTTGLLSLGRNAIKVATAKNIAYFGGGQYGSFADPVYTKNVDVYNFGTNTWTLKKLSKAREVGAAASIANKILFAGGRDALTMYNTVDIFDVATGALTAAKLSKARTNIAVGINGSKVVFAGGWFFDFNYNRPASDVVDIYDAATNTWSTAVLSQKRQEISVASVGNKIVFAGGLPNSGVSNKVDIYDASNNTWSTATLSAPRYAMTVNVIANKAYFASGVGASNRIDVYDADLNAWTVLTMPYNLASAAGAVVNGKQLFYAGGYDPSTYAVSNAVQTYNTISNTWTTGVISQARAGSNVVSIATLTLFAGGFTKVTYPSVGSTRLDIYKAAPIALAAEQKNAFDFTVAPNPVYNEIQFSAKKYASLPIELNVYSDKGNVVAAFKIENVTTVINLKNIPTGKYVLSAIDAAGNKASKLVLKQ
jgi:hypothetical protein